MMYTCTLCATRGGPQDLALDLGRQPSMRHYPAPADPLPDPTYPLALWVCPGCGLAQLVEDTSDGPEIPVPEPAAVTATARQAVADLSDLLVGRRTVRAFASPHGGSGIQSFVAHGLTEVSDVADVVADSFGIMHDADQAAAFAQRASAVAPGGLLVLTIQPLDRIVATDQWTALRHGHVAYYSLTALREALDRVGFGPVRLRRYALYGGTAVVAAERGGTPDDALLAAYATEAAAGLTTPAGLAPLRSAIAESLDRLRSHLDSRAAEGVRLFAYGAPSRATSLLASVGASSRALIAVADAAISKQGHALPVSRIPVIAPADLLAADPDEVLLLLDDLYDEVLATYPGLAGRLVRLSEAVT